MSQSPEWHIEKTINIGHIITTISIVVAAIWWASTVETRIAVNSQKIAAADMMMKRQDDASATMRQEVRSGFDRLDTKMDRIIERGR